MHLSRFKTEIPQLRPPQLRRREAYVCVYICIYIYACIKTEILQLRPPHYGVHMCVYIYIHVYIYVFAFDQD